MENLYITKIIKNGTSLAIVLPINFLRALDWQRGDYVGFRLADGSQMVLKKITDNEIKSILPREIISLI